MRELGIHTLIVNINVQTRNEELGLTGYRTDLEQIVTLTPKYLAQFDSDREAIASMFEKGIYLGKEVQHVPIKVIKENNIDEYDGRPVSNAAE